MKRLTQLLQKKRTLFFLAVLAGISLIMPLTVNLTSSSQKFSLFSRAEKYPELRIWLEPATVIVKPNETILFKLYADFDAENLILPGFTTKIQPETGLKASPEELFYLKPFRGQIEAGTFEVKPTVTGQYNLNLSVVSTGLNKQLDIKISPVTIISEN